MKRFVLGRTMLAAALGLPLLTQPSSRPTLMAAPATVGGHPARTAATEPAQPSALRFAFGTGPTLPGYTRVAPNARYKQAAGFGFEDGAKVTASDRGGSGGDAGPARGGSCSSDAPFFFSAAVPAEGNYRVTVTLGDAAAAADTTVKAELRRLMVERARTAPGAFVTRSFVVNVRTPNLPGGGRVKLKAPRETTDEAWAWDGRVTLEFDGSRPAVAAVEIEPADVPTVYVMGDSTVCDQSKEPYASWGQMLPRFLDAGVAVANHAESGDTLANAAGARRLEKVLSLLKTGDLVLIQYGHNDMKAKVPDAAAAYKATLKRWVGQVKDRGGVPVLVTPMNRHSFDGTVVINSLRDYPDKVREAAREEHVALVDLNAMSKALYEALGPAESARLFAHPNPADPTKFDGTHHGPYGAYELARCVAEGLRRDVPALARHLTADVPPFDPAKPDPFASFAVPPSPGLTARRPLGD